MEQYGIWLLLAAGELVLILLLTLLAIWLRQRAATQRDRRAVRALVERVRKDKIARREQIRSFLSGQFGLSGDELAESVHRIYQGEVSLIQTFAKAYLNRNAAIAANFRVEVEAGVDPYWTLSAEGGAGTAAVAEASAEADAAAEESAAEAAPSTEEATSGAEVERLRGENNRLSEELRVTMDTMSRMLNEYSTIFSKDADLSEITVVDEQGQPLDAESTSEMAEAAAEESLPGDGEEAEAASALPADEDQDATATEPAAEDVATETSGDTRPTDGEQPVMEAAAEQPDEAAEEIPGETPEGVPEQVPVTPSLADRAPPLDPAMRDLSFDEDPAQADSAPEQETGSPEDAQAAERRRMIDADS